MKSDKQVFLSSLEMVRGFNDRFYFVEEDVTTHNSTVIEINFDQSSSNLSYTKREVYCLSASKIVSL